MFSPLLANRHPKLSKLMEKVSEKSLKLPEKMPIKASENISVLRFT